MSDKSLKGESTKGSAKSIDQLLELAIHGTKMVVPSSWGQGRTVFGGLTAALLNQAMRRELPDAYMLRVQNTQFIGPVLLDEPFEIEVTHLRDGKNVTQLQGRIVQDGQIAAQANVAYGIERESKITFTESNIELPSAPEKATWIPQIPKITPKFHKHMDIKIVDGGAPFSGKKTAIYNGWMRFSKSPGVITDAQIIALIDVWPPTVLQTLKWPVPASTLSWNVEFIHPHPVISASEWLAYRCITRQAAGGYAHTEASIYTQSGQLIAISRQTVTVFG